MARVFTIAEGLENMGAIKTGGQGSVYKGRRIGEIISAIKILPTPISSESADDKNYTAFINEVEKLKKVNEDPNPNVVKILSSGITNSGNFPFIEMEFIEGPDLEELLKLPNSPVFTIKEVLKVAVDLSNALSHCHKVDVRHGDIKSNNVKYNKNTGNYVLLDFGLAAMSDEQRRTSLRHAGAIEFMAPEQNDGVMLLQTDVYSFGIVLFELLAGRVPFPLNSNGETGRNEVMVAHLEKLPPDILQLRRQAMPINWSFEKKEQEMLVPEWLVNLIYKCLEKKPENRISNGMQLHEQICNHSVGRTGSAVSGTNEHTAFLEEENKRLRHERDLLQQKVSQYEATNNNSVSQRFVTESRKNKNQEKTEKLPKKAIPVYQKYLLLFFFVLIGIVGLVYLLTSSKKETERPVSKKVVTPTVITPTEPAEVKNELRSARQFLTEGKLVEAFAIYSSLSQKQVPEAMYYYGKLALQNKNSNITCAEAFELLKSASDKGYAPAKRTLGFLYSFSDNKDVLKQAYYYERCSIRKNITKGASLLMEATLLGDTTALRMLNELNKSANANQFK